MLRVLCLLVLCGAAWSEKCSGLLQRKEICCEDVGCFKKAYPHDGFPLPCCQTQDDLEFRLYTRDNRKGYRKMWKGERIPAEYDSSVPTLFVIHGWNGHGMDEWMLDIKNAMLDREPLNVVLINWKTGAGHVNYPVSASNTRVVGAMTGDLMAYLASRTGAALADMWCVGHSLGAHTCGFAGKRVNAKLGRITGLDPAGPWFESVATLDVGLNAKCAQFVDVIHSDTKSSINTYGTTRPLGHMDFYPNGLGRQPGCLDRKKRSFHPRDVRLPASTKRPATGTTQKPHTTHKPAHTTHKPAHTTHKPSHTTHAASTRTPRPYTPEHREEIPQQVRVVSEEEEKAMSEMEIPQQVHVVSEEEEKAMSKMEIPQQVRVVSEEEEKAMLDMEIPQQVHAVKDSEAVEISTHDIPIPKQVRVAKEGDDEVEMEVPARVHEATAEFEESMSLEEEPVEMPEPDEWEDEEHHKQSRGKIGCSHSRAYEYFVHSIRDHCFVAKYRCTDLYDMPGSCVECPNHCASMGYAAKFGRTKDNTPGIFYLETTRRHPHCIAH